MYSMTKMVSVTQYVHVIMFKKFNIYELDYKRIYFVASAVRLLDRLRPHTLLIGCDFIDSVASRVVRTHCDGSR